MAIFGPPPLKYKAKPSPSYQTTVDSPDQVTVVAKVEKMEDCINADPPADDLNVLLWVQTQGFSRQKFLNIRNGLRRRLLGEQNRCSHQ